MGWFFSKKREISREEFENLVDSIKKSFTNVKNDISKIKEKTSSNEKRADELNHTIINLAQSVEIIDNKIDSFQNRSARQSRAIQSPEENSEDEFAESIKSSSIKDKQNVAERHWDTITNTQRSIAINLKKLMNEGGKDWIAMKYLAEELYPNTDYADIKAMFSNYTDLLDELGFIEKRRKRRETFLRITEKAIPFVPKEVLTIKKKKKDL